MVYQIYPWSFKDINGDGIGDLKGIIEKLDYLNDGTPNSLGVGAIWLSPIFTSPMRDYGYDISDYCSIDPRFGTMEDFELLVEEAHRRNIRILLDNVSSHTSSEHPWFRESRSSQYNPKHDWYVWKDAKPDGSPPNNWLSMFGGPGWTFDEQAGRYYFHHFLKDQPDLNWRNPEVRGAIKQVMDFWLTKGVDGFRVDALSHFIEDSEFRDNPINEHYIEGKHNPYFRLIPKYSIDQPEIRDVVEFFCQTLSNYNERFMISESNLSGQEFFNAYRYSENKLHAPFNFNLMFMRWNAGTYRKFIDHFDSTLTRDEVPTYVLGNHDQPRIASRFDENRARLLSMLIFTLRGMPFVYYGEELGLRNVHIPAHKRKDIFSIETHNKSTGRDPARTPMQWDATSHAGFSDVEPWLPVAPDYKERNVAVQNTNPTSMLNFYRRLLHFRNNSESILNGSHQSLRSTSRHIYSYVRECGGEKILVILNFSKDSVTEPIPLSGKLFCTTYMDRPEGEHAAKHLTLRPYEGCVLRI